MEYEYQVKRVDARIVMEIQRVLDGMVEKGWDFVHADGDMLYFRRSIYKPQTAVRLGPGR